MKRMHLQLLKKANCVLASLLMLLGFSCTDDEGEGPIICEYGSLRQFSDKRKSRGYKR